MFEQRRNWQEKFKKTNLEDLSRLGFNKTQRVKHFPIYEKPETNEIIIYNPQTKTIIEHYRDNKLVDYK